MKQTSFLLLIFLLTTTAAFGEPSMSDDAMIFHALKVEPVVNFHPTDGYEMLTKAVPGFIDCRLSVYQNGVRAYLCTYGTHDGFSMADVAYDFLDVPETFIKTDRRGRWYEKKIGALNCTKVLLHKPEDMMPSLSKCDIKLSFGMLNN